MERLASYVGGKFVQGTGKQAVLVNPTTEEPVAETSTEGIDMGAALAHANTGGARLRAMTFAQRGEVLRGMSKAIYAAREELIELGVANAGNTRGDAKFDIDGASGTLMAYADMGKELGDATFFVDGDPIVMGRSSRMAGQHAWVPREGVAVHVNAFNFPAWGLAEKVACAFLAGMPVISKPATATAWMTARLVQRVVEANVLPEGTLSLLAGSAGDLIARLGAQDVLAFTGSSDTGTRLRVSPNMVSLATRVNVEADSLNVAVLGPDVERGSETYQLFLADVVRDVTQKAGQKCTAIRRVLAPASLLAAVTEDLAERIGAAKVGDPSRDGMQVGPVATADQLRDVRAGIDALAKSERVKLVVGGSARPKSLEGISGDKGYFVAPTLLVADDARAAKLVHEHEVFGPSTTLMPYDGKASDAVAIVRLGQGGLVASVYTDDKAFARELVLGLAPWNGRVFIGSAKVAGVSLGPGTVMPQLTHGGPGRAGGGEELGGLRGMQLYLHRVALQGYGPLVESIVLGARRFALAIPDTIADNGVGAELEGAGFALGSASTPASRGAAEGAGRGRGGTVLVRVTVASGACAVLAATTGTGNGRGAPKNGLPCDAAYPTRPLTSAIAAAPIATRVASGGGSTRGGRAVSSCGISDGAFAGTANARSIAIASASPSSAADA